jgi:phospholipid/cholesterol/gamma-HCH transport system substrate-binding protein
MRRLLAMAALLAAVGIVAVLGTGADDGDGGAYKVRAIFSNAFSVIPGEDVKISGVKVGSIESLDVTDDHKAAVVLDITEPGFQDFRKDGTCTIRPQSLIGEKFVECTPTQPRAQGDAPAAKLDKIENGDGKGQYLMPVDQTRNPVDLDLLNNIMRLPYRERFTIILNELGVGLAANGANLRQAVRSANPALEETDKVLKILAQQNKVLAGLARNGDEVLRPLARDRGRVADFIVKANTTARASAERRVDIERNIEKFPAFLRQLEPTMRDLGALSDQITPVMEDLGPHAADISRFIEQLGPFSQAGIPAFQTLGEASVPGREALLAAKPIVDDLQTFAGQAKPLTKNLSGLLSSFQSTGGIERLMDFLFYQASAINGFDDLGHYLRAVLVVNTCSTYEYRPEGTPGCDANFRKDVSASTAARNAPSPATVADEIAGGRSPFLAGQGAVLNGLDPAALLTAAKGGDPSTGEAKAKKGTTGAAAPKIELPSAFLPGEPADGTPAEGEAGSKAAGPVAPSSQAGAADDPTSTLLDYLLGG